MLICVKSKHGCSSGMMSWNVIVMRLVCKDSNNVDSEIHYFKDGSIPLFCSVDFFGCLQGDITVHHILSNFMMLLWYCSCGASLYQLFLLICAHFPHFYLFFSRICAHFLTFAPFFRVSQISSGFLTTFFKFTFCNRFHSLKGFCLHFPFSADPRDFPSILRAFCLFFNFIPHTICLYDLGVVTPKSYRHIVRGCEKKEVFSCFSSLWKKEKFQKKKVGKFEEFEEN